MNLLDLLPVDILIHEIAPADYTVYHALVVGYPRFARALSPKDIAQFRERFIKYHEMNGGDGLSIQWTTVGGFLQNIGGAPAIAYFGRYYGLSAPCQSPKFYIKGGILQLIESTSYDRQYTSCAFHACTNNRVWGREHIIRQHRKSTMSDYLKPSILPFYGVPSQPEYIRPLGKSISLAADEFEPGYRVNSLKSLPRFMPTDNNYSHRCKFVKPTPEQIAAGEVSIQPIHELAASLRHDADLVPESAIYGVPSMMSELFGLYPDDEVLEYDRQCMNGEMCEEYDSH